MPIALNWPTLASAIARLWWRSPLRPAMKTCLQASCAHSTAIGRACTLSTAALRRRPRNRCSTHGLWQVQRSRVALILFLLVNPDAGDRAAQRVSFGGNPQADSDWPVEKLEYRSADGEATEMELAFTFADYALLMPALHEHFRVVASRFRVRLTS